MGKAGAARGDASMTETFAALLCAHVLADFVFQTRWIAGNKRRAPVLLLHGAVVLATAQAALGRVDAWELLALAALHIAIEVDCGDALAQTGLTAATPTAARQGSGGAATAPETWLPSRKHTNIGWM